MTSSFHSIFFKTLNNNITKTIGKRADTGRQLVGILGRRRRASPGPERETLEEDAPEKTQQQLLAQLERA